MLSFFIHSEKDAVPKCKQVTQIRSYPFLENYHVTAAILISTLNLNSKHQ